jgi:methyltransferase (TIGR00027 family)
MAGDPLIRNISDTALWAAAFRAQETQRPDALFRDPLAERLASERGMQALREMPSGDRHAWAWVTRTYVHDQLIAQCVARDIDAVVNLAAGLDARPYRMDLPAALKWYEVDLPELIDYKQEILAGERPRCEVERIPLDLANTAGRNELLDRIAAEARNILVITEGLLIYLEREQVAQLARDLARNASFQFWSAEICSPGLLRMLQRRIGGRLEAARAPLKFGPAEGPEFFAPYGWRAVEIRPLLKAAATLKRIPFLMRFLAKLPASNGRQGNRPWSAVCLFARS